MAENARRMLSREAEYRNLIRNQRVEDRHRERLEDRFSHRHPNPPVLF
jgi:hypothetical protein